MFPGIDIIEIARFTRACTRHPQLLSRLFTSGELKAMSDKKYNSWAARFAGKEAVLKALGTGLNGLTWHDIEIFTNERGEPVVYLSERAQKIALSRGGKTLKLSLAHSKENAIAIAILE